MLTATRQDESSGELDVIADDVSPDAVGMERGELAGAGLIRMVEAPGDSLLPPSARERC